VSWCPFPLFRSLGLVICYVVINTDLPFISLFVALCVKLDPGTHNGNAFSFSLKTGCDIHPISKSSTKFVPILSPFGNELIKHKPREERDAMHEIQN
jgi:hypothetical protein